ncbi:alanine--tRNA ligase [Candidatus Phytoplasma sp. AldY-WA1]|jgi:alanyl-tRNA synthetase|uniref:alanine--tRNA ligase n=1 Tax=Candidatus Phytoplasma sp. AldY-WA1 TaxID=2852100 RepID=UPI00254AC2E2|nr:alanine--tRNA ligase [Candidatus Phytoplasma sp. AldY-WA1]
MKKMTTNEIRKMWLDFFVEKGHHLENSSSLIPDFSDPSLLWVNAGVVPFKKYFDGSEKAFCPKIVSIQKCLRTNDIENVGKNSIHHTFFEMLGNFSIGNYFKKEAIDLAYELLISNKWFAFPKDRLYITYFYQDQATYDLWLKKGIASEHLIPLKDNFWEISEGPCGPCTEIFFDRGVEYDQRGLELLYEDISNDRFLEIWNIVFSQYNSESGKNREKYLELPSKNIDTGAGLERLACIFQDKKTSFETDLFFPIIKKISFLIEVEYSEQKETFRIIADHIKTLVFGIGDGVLFANEGRGYILKKLLRRGFTKGKTLGFQKPFLFKLVSVVIDIMKEFYPYLIDKKEIIENIIKKEEEKFVFNLNKGQKLFFQLVQNNTLSGENFFKLYDTYGLPMDIIYEYAKQNNIHIDEQKFQIYLEEQKKLSRGAQNNKYSMNKQNDLFLKFNEKNEFVGYNKFSIKTKVLKVFDEGIVLKETPFYPEMGGQIYDIGMIDDLAVVKVTKLPNQQIIHQLDRSISPLINFFTEGKEVTASIDTLQRKKTSYNHTATHLLYDSLKLILGEHVKQRGSSLNSNYLRFDFNHFQNLSFENLIKIENKVNEWINQKHPVIIEETSLLEAKKRKIQFLDNTNYQDKVRIVKIGDFSIQLCGGTHATNTSDLKKFAIVNYKIIGSGIYRIEAVTDSNVFSALNKKIEPFILEEKQIFSKIEEIHKDIYLEEFLSKIEKIAIQKNYKDSYAYIQNYKNYLQVIRKEFSEFKKQILQKRNEQIIKKYKQFIPDKIEPYLMIVVDNHHELTNNDLKVLLDHLFNILKVDFLCLCKKNLDQVFILCKSKIINVDNFIQKVAKTMNGKGGGNKNFGQLTIYEVNRFIEFKNNWKVFL